MPFVSPRKLYALFLRSLVSYKISEDISIISFQSLRYNQTIDYLLHAKTCFLHKKKTSFTILYNEPTFLQRFLNNKWFATLNINTKMCFLTL